MTAWQVMVIGIGCTMSDWTPRLLRALAASREVIIFDNAGIGGSTIAGAGQPDAADYFRFQAQSIAGLISTLGLDHPDILGWCRPLHLRHNILYFAPPNCFVPPTSSCSYSLCDAVHML